MNPTQYHTYREIVSQPQAWETALDRTRTVDLPAADAFDQVLFTGCGSTYYLSLAAAALFQSVTERPARAAPGGELLLNPQTVLSPGRTLLVAVSRSGTTTETVKAVESFKAAARGPVVAITNYDSHLAQLVDAAIIIPDGQEKSVAQTRSFASMFVAATVFSLRMAGEQDGLLTAMEALPAVGERLLRDYDSLAREMGENLDFDRFYFLGSGVRYGLASEANLKLKEMTLTHSEPFHFLEFRHGPMSMVNDRSVIVGLLSDKNRRHEQAVLDEMAALRGHILALGEDDASIAFHSGLPELIRNVLYLPPLQLMAFYRALAKGLNPDRPQNLTAVVRLDEML